MHLSTDLKCVQVKIDMRNFNITIIGYGSALEKSSEDMGYLGRLLPQG